MIKISTILIFFGLLAMYLAGEKALTTEKKNMKTEGEKQEKWASMYEC